MKFKIVQEFSPNTSLRWSQSHAYVPTPLLLGDRIRVFYSGWDAMKVGRIGFADFEREPPYKNFYTSTEPCFDIGERGMFDEHGVTPSCLTHSSDQSLMLYYIGWQKQASTRYTLFAGRAVSTDNGESWERTSKTPFLDRHHSYGLFVRTSPFVVDDLIFYTSGSNWIQVREGAAGSSFKEIPTYSLRVIDNSKIDDDDYDSPVIIRGLPLGTIGVGRSYLWRGIDSLALSGLFSIRVLPSRPDWTRREPTQHYAIWYGEQLLGQERKTFNLLKQVDIIGNLTGTYSTRGTLFKCEWSQAFPYLLDDGKRTLMFFNGDNFGEGGFFIAEQVKGENNQGRSGIRRRGARQL